MDSSDNCITTKNKNYEVQFQHTYSVCFFASFTFSQGAVAQDKDDIKMAKTIHKIGAWQSKQTFKDGREFNFEAVAGKVVMTFTTRTQKKTKQIEVKGKIKKKKVKEVINSFKMEVGGNDRIFNYVIESDSVKFDSVKGFKDFKIVRADKDELVLEQELDGSLFRWVMKPAPKEK